MGFSILPRNRLCSIMISGFWLGFRGLSPYSFGILFHNHFLVPARVPGLVSLLFWHPVPSSFPGILFHHPFLVPARVPGLASLYSFGILFHHPFLVPARVPGLVSILFWHPVPSSFLVPARVPGLVALYSFGILFHHHFMVPAGVPGLVAQTALELNGVLNSSKKQFCSTMIFWFRVF